MNVIKTVAILFLSCFITTFIQAQTSFNLYPLNGVVGIKFFSEKKISLEPRLDFQFDYADGQTNLFLNTELHTTINFIKEEKYNIYTGIGLGANIYNQAQSNFSGSIPIGATYYLNESKRTAIIGEWGLKITALNFIKVKPYALVGIQLRLKK